jgi:hypothetical protein
MSASEIDAIFSAHKLPSPPLSMPEKQKKKKKKKEKRAISEQSAAVSSPPTDAPSTDQSFPKGKRPLPETFTDPSLDTKRLKSDKPRVKQPLKGKLRSNSSKNAFADSRGSSSRMSVYFPLHGRRHKCTPLTKVERQPKDGQSTRKMSLDSPILAVVCILLALTCVFSLLFVLQDTPLCPFDCDCCKSPT